MPNRKCYFLLLLIGNLDSSIIIMKRIQYFWTITFQTIIIELLSIKNFNQTNRFGAIVPANILQPRLTTIPDDSRIFRPV